MIRVGIIGATGYVGMELVRLCLQHPQISITRLVSHSAVGQDLRELVPSLRGQALPLLSELSIDTLTKDCDIVFTSLPHGTSEDTIPALVEAGLVVIDMSADYRYRDAAVYASWYKTEHKHPALLEQAVYGLPEIYADKIARSNLIGNPGCYTTASILALAPLLRAGHIRPSSILIDAKSGASGAGRGLSQQTHFCELDESLKAYGVATHRHTSEIEQELSLAAGETVLLSFTPHLLPIKRGILATCYADLQDAACTADALYKTYQSAYLSAPFVHVYAPGTLPEISHVVGSNFCHIGFVIDARLRRVVVVSCIDNMIKGAAGQAIQNMNIRFGLDQTLGLRQPGYAI